MFEVSEQKRIYWCQCIWDIINYHKNIDRAKGILQWSEGKKYTKVTSGAESALRDTLKNLQNIVQRCDFYPEGYVEAQKHLDEARLGSPIESLKHVDDAERIIRLGMSKQCQFESKIYFEETRGAREKSMEEWRALRRASEKK